MADSLLFRVNDWLHGVRQAQPDRDTQNLLTSDPLTNAERLRLIYQLITGLKSDGGAEITPGKGEWKNVQSVFALHDPAANKAWIKQWSSKTILTPEDLDSLRENLGEKVCDLDISQRTLTHPNRLPTTLPSSNPTLFS